MPGLTVSRRVNETILIGQAVVEVVKLKGNQVHLNVQAPEEVVIRRGELEGVDRGPTKAYSKPSASSDERRRHGGADNTRLGTA